MTQAWNLSACDKECLRALCALWEGWALERGGSGAKSWILLAEHGGRESRRIRTGQGLSRRGAGTTIVYCHSRSNRLESIKRKDKGT